MEPMKGAAAAAGGGRRVAVGEDDLSDGMQCTDHPYTTNPGGICAFCLQEKLGKLVSSSFPLPLRPSTSSSSSPSFRSDNIAAASSSTNTRPSSSLAAAAPAASSSSLSLSVPPPNNNASHYHDYYTRKSRLPFLLAKKKKKKPSSNPKPSEITLKRSKSTATPRRGRSFADAEDDDFSPRKRNGFWSFLHLSSKTSASAKKLNSKSFRDTPRGSSLGRKTDIVVEEDNSPNSHSSVSASSFERKVSRSRSVGCGSRSFSGDFFERISTGFGDCTLRRVESQREGKSKVAAVNRRGDHHHHHHCMKERVRCAGIFSGFMMTSSSSSSSSSSYWVSSSADDNTVNVNGNGKSASVALSHNRGRSWGWAFASPMRAFSGKTSSKENRRDIIRDANDHKSNATPNLSAIPSLLAARG